MYAVPSIYFVIVPGGEILLFEKVSSSASELGDCEAKPNSCTYLGERVNGTPCNKNSYPQASIKINCHGNWIYCKKNS